MDRYAEIIDGKVWNIIVADAAYIDNDPSYVLLSPTDYVDIGFLYDGATFTDPNPPLDPPPEDPPV